MRADTLDIRLAFGLLALAAAAPGCKHKSGPSEHYDRGTAIHQRLYVREIDDAYLDPQMDDAVRELKQVEADSVSYPLALELLAQIDKGKKDAQAARDQRAKALAEMEKSAPAPVIDAAKMGFAAPPPRAAPDAGAIADDPFGPGASIAEINSATGGCLVPQAPFHEEGSKVMGTAYRVSGSLACQEKLPGMVGQLILSVDGKILRRIAESDAQPQGGRPDAGARPAQATGPQTGAQQAQPGTAPYRRPEPPPAYEGQKDAPKPEETAPGQVEDSTPKPAQ
jgi:hypothetical protein